MKVVFIVGGGGKSGLGHAVRCKHLIKVLQEKHRAKVEIILAKHGPGADEMLADWSLHQTENLRKFTKYSLWWYTLDADVVVIDLEEGVPLWLVDELRQIGRHKIISICGTAYEPSVASWSMDAVIIQGVPQYPLRNGAYAGLDWAILDPRFPKVRTRGKGIYVSGGGTDVANMTAKLLDGLNSIGEKQAVHVVVGPGFLHESDMQEAVDRSHHSVSIWRNTDIPELLDMCHLGLVSYGMSVLECLAAGIPTICVGISDAHVQAAQGLGDTVKLLGYSYEVDEYTIGRSVASLLENSQERQRMIEQGRRLMDGQGVYRVAKKIKEVVDAH